MSQARPVEGTRHPSPDLAVKNRENTRARTPACHARTHARTPACHERTDARTDARTVTAARTHACTHAFVHAFSREWAGPVEFGFAEILPLWNASKKSSSIPRLEKRPQALLNPLF